VPNDTLPLVAWAGPLAPALDNALRPLVEKAYSRPIDIPDPTPPAAGTTRSPASSARSAARSARAAGAARKVAAGKRSQRQHHAASRRR
jgi:hypothetical protein